MVPISLLVSVLSWLGAINFLALWLDPVMRFIGLPGSASLVLLSSIFLNIYSAIAVIDTIRLSGRALVIVALMCLIAHSLPVESAIMKRTGSSVLKMTVLRLGMMLLVAWGLNLVLPPDKAQPLVANALNEQEEALAPNDAGLSPQVFWGSYRYPDPLASLRDWAISTVELLIKMTLIILGLMLIQRLITELGLVAGLSKLFRPVVALIGLPARYSLLWIVVQVVGYTYGAAVLVEEINEGRLSKLDSDLLNHNAAICHSLLEDTTLFATLGVPVWLLVLPRLLLSALIVWLERARRWLFRKSFQAGTL
jgi:hypothetical protein